MGIMKLKIEFDREEDGRWIADIEALPGVRAYGQSRDEAAARVKAIALQTLAAMAEEEGGAIDDAILFEAA
jgi:predicted RNase H-like HicB family nuclease